MTKKEWLWQATKDDGSGCPTIDWNAFGMIFNDPINTYLKGTRERGKITLDRFGAAFSWPQDAIDGMPYVTADNKAIPDITEWESTLQIPDLENNCTDWTAALERKAEIDPEKQLVVAFSPDGIFERLHALMGFEDTLMNFLLEPEAMMGLCNALGDYKLKIFQMIIDNLHPDMICHHDDWGAKDKLFMSPQIFREFIKPQYEKIYGYAKEKGVLIMHHADSFCEPLLEDMVDLGIDIWQGVLPQNDIVAIQEKLQGRMILMGGIDAGIVDRADATEEEIRQETRRACSEYMPGGNFIPGITYGGPDIYLFPHVKAPLDDEMAKYLKETYC